MGIQAMSWFVLKPANPAAFLRLPLTRRLGDQMAGQFSMHGAWDLGPNTHVPKV